MPEYTLTTPLELASDTDADEKATEDKRPVMVDIDHVSMVFNMASQQLNSLKEYAIALARRELMFKEFHALDDVSFTVRKGDVFGILGTNGSGKSTMLKIIAGVLEPTHGTCTIGGSIAPLIELGAGFDMDLTARENIFLNGALLGYSKKFIQQHFDEIVAFAEVEEFLDMPMKNYSSGMVARIAFAIATVIVPEILIVDEVLSVGDFMFQQKCERRIMQLIKEHDVTVLIVSHSNDQIERLCNRAIWIEKGHTRMMGSAEDVCRAYRVLGGHIGSANSEAAIFKLLQDKTKVPENTVTTIYGEDRYGTAAKLVDKCSFDPGGALIVASPELPLPCISAQGLAGELNAPVILSKPDALPDVSSQEISKLAPSRIVLIGSKQLLSAEVEAQVSEAAGSNCAIERIEGSDAMGLALGIYEYGKGSWGTTAILAQHECIGDLISLSPFMLERRVPTFFIQENGTIGSENEQALLSGGFERIIVLGGEVQMPEEALMVFRNQGIKAERIMGRNAYNANEVINNLLAAGRIDGQKMLVSNLIVCTSWNPSGAFAAAWYAAKTKSMFLLEDPQNLDSVSHAIYYIRRQEGAVKGLIFIGDRTQFTDVDRKLLAKAVAKVQNNAKKGISSAPSIEEAPPVFVEGDLGAW